MPTSSCSPAPSAASICAGTRAPEMALRLKYAGWPEDAIEVRARSRPRSTRRSRRRRGASSPCPPTRPCSSCATLLADRGLAKELLAVSGRRSRLARVECRRYAADLRALGGAGAPASDGPVARARCGAGRVALHLAGRGHEVIGAGARPGPDRPSSSSSGERGRLAHDRRRRPGAPATLRAARRPRRWSSRPLQLIQLLDGGGERAALLGRVAGAACARRHAGPRRWSIESTAAQRGSRSDPILPDVRELDGWVYSSLPLGCRSSDERSTVRRLRRARLARAASIERDRPRRDRFTARPRGARARGDGGRACARSAGDDRSGETRGRLHRRSSWACRDERGR